MTQRLFTTAISPAARPAATRGVSPAGAVRKHSRPKSRRDMAGYRVRTSGTIGGITLRDITKPGVSVAAYRGVTASLCDCLASVRPWCRHRLLCAWLDRHRPGATEVEIISSGRDDCPVCGGEGLHALTYVPLGAGGYSGYFSASVRPGCACEGEWNCEGGHVMIRDPSCPIMPKALRIESRPTKSGNVSILLTLIAGGKELKREYIIKPENAREFAAILTRHADELEAANG